MKTCNRCNQEKQYSEFHNYKQSKDGYRAYCKVCAGKMVKQYYKENKESRLAYAKAWREENIEKAKETNSNWRANNRDRMASYRKENTEKLSQQWKERYKANPSKVKERNRKIDKSIEPGVYMITCIVNGKQYIGESNQPYARRTQHFSKWQTKKHCSNQALQEDLLKYGKDNFKFEILEHCIEEDLLAKEDYYIRKIKPEYNRTVL